MRSRQPHAGFFLSSNTADRKFTNTRRNRRMKNVTRLLLVSAITIAAGVAIAQTPPAPTQGRGAAAAGRGAAAPATEWLPGYVDPTNPQPAYMPPETPLG